MKILVCGDSWTEGWGVDSNQSWTNYLDAAVLNVAQSGATNLDILTQVVNHIDKDKFDAVIIGWSGATRFQVAGNLFEFSTINKKTENFFQDKSLNEIIGDWESKINVANQCAFHKKISLIHFDVFGDKTNKHYDNYLNISFLEFLANQNNTYFKHDIPIFEYDWLYKHNYKFIKKFAKKYFEKDWQQACVEREGVRSSKYFLPCGHPSALGHKVWGLHIKEKLNDFFKK